jgi:peroxiredoxin Q/BCP
LKEGQYVPLNVELFDHNANPITLEKYLGTYLVLYFYPKDYTPGCTLEACSFRDNNDEIEKLDAKVIGISADSVERHKGFKDKFNLNFDLLADVEHKFSQAMGVWEEKKMFGKLGFGIRRSTFIIDPKGKILKIWPNVSVNGHTEEVLDFLKGLQDE